MNEQLKPSHGVIVATVISLILWAMLFAGVIELFSEDQATGAYRKHRKPACEWCGCTNELEVHHVITQAEIRTYGLADSLYDDDPDNLVTLCDCPKHRCHLIVGHRGDFSRNNHAVKAMIMLLETERKLGERK